MGPKCTLKAGTIVGYRPFDRLVATFGALEVFVGANGSGKSSLFEFLRFIRDSVHEDIPPEIIHGAIGQQIFHIPGPQRFEWSMEISMGKRVPILYEGQLMGPVGRTHVTFEKVETAEPLGPQYRNRYVYMDIKGGKGVIQDPVSKRLGKQELALKRPNQLALSTITNPSMETLHDLAEYIRQWRFYSSFNIANEKIRKSVPIEQNPVLYEDAGNLSSVLHYLFTEHPDAFDELKTILKGVVPGFNNLSVKARGGPGEVIAFWSEKGLDGELNLADLSDGILRLLCWITLCVHPDPPSLICIDEPDQGVHPRTLPIIAELLERASERTQILVATHSSYFLVQFDISRLSVFRKDNGAARLVKPINSKALMANLHDFGMEEIEIMHRNDEIEAML